MPKIPTAAMALTLAALGACGTQAPTRPSTPASDHKVIEASPEQVATCQYLDEVSSVSGKGLLAAAARAAARNEVLNKAGALGGPHVVWLDSSEVYQTTTTRA